MIIDHDAKTEDEFKASAAPIILDLLKTLQQHKPNVIDAAQALTEILAGCLIQIEDDDQRNNLRDLIIRCLTDADAPQSNYVDFSDRIKPN